jgi:hypothetical protein
VGSAPAAPRVPETRTSTPAPAAALDRPAPPARAAAPPSAPAPVATERSEPGRAAPSPAMRPARGPQEPAAPPPAAVARAAPPRAVSPASPPAAVPTAPAADLKARAARLSIQVLSWAPERKDRFVFLNGRKYGEGQMVDDTFVVEQITEDSVVLSARGERVTLKGR